MDIKELLSEGDILTRVEKYNLIRQQRMLHIDVHEQIAGNLAGSFVAVPNLINIIASSDFQGVGDTTAAALEDCLKKIRDLEIMDIFPSIRSGEETQV